jgi:hypothetical protein
MKLYVYNTETGALKAVVSERGLEEGTWLNVAISEKPLTPEQAIQLGKEQLTTEYWRKFNN